MTLQELVTQYGVVAGLLILTILQLIQIMPRFFKAGVSTIESENKKDDAITDLALTSNAERRERQEVIDKLQTSNNHLQAEVFAIQLKQAEESGRREEIKESMQRERDEWKAERLANDEKFRKMESDILELKKHRDQSTLRISELENQIADLEKKLATANVEIDILQAQKRELESLLQKEINRAKTLSELVDKIRVIDGTPVNADNTQSIPDMRDVDDTFITEPNLMNVITPETIAQNESNLTSAATIAAEETNP